MIEFKEIVHVAGVPFICLAMFIISSSRLQEYGLRSSQRNALKQSFSEVVNRYQEP